MMLFGIRKIERPAQSVRTTGSRVKSLSLMELTGSVEKARTGSGGAVLVVARILDESHRGREMLQSLRFVENAFTSYFTSYFRRGNGGDSGE